jgi:ferrous iron transport protein B
MVDVAEERGMRVDAAALESILGVRVVSVNAASGRGIGELVSAIESPLSSTSSPWYEGSGDDADGAASTTAASCSRWSVDQDGRARAMQEAAESIDAALSLATQSELEKTFRRYAWIDAALERMAVDVHRRKALARDRIDRVLLHPFFGLLAFAAVMSAFFCVVFYAGDALRSPLELIASKVGESVAAIFPSGGLLRDLWLDGVVAGLVPVASFLPQIVVIFVLLTALDGSGYLARGAFLLDRLLSSIGLHGRSFVPLITSYACAVPGIMAARTIPDVRERIATMFVAPFMACPARLPVYTLIVGSCFPNMSGWQKSLVMVSLYVGGIVVAVLVSIVLRLTALRGKGASFLIELPTYQLPDLGEMWRAAKRAVKTFVHRAATVIVVFSVVLWAAMTFPQLDRSAWVQPANSTQTFEQAQLEYSLAGTIGHIIEPVVAPAGMDWRIGVGLVGAFAAREAFISTLGMVYGARDSGEGGGSTFYQRMQSATRADGTLVWTPLMGAVVLVWFMLAMQCASTVIVMAKETRSWRWAIAQILVMNSLAWIFAVIIWQIGSIAG